MRSATCGLAALFTSLAAVRRAVAIAQSVHIVAMLPVGKQIIATLSSLVSRVIGLFNPSVSVTGSMWEEMINIAIGELFEIVSEI